VAVAAAQPLGDAPEMVELVEARVLDAVGRHVLAA